MLEWAWKRRASVLAALCVHCVDTQPLTDFARSSQGRLELRASDARGEPADHEQLPRRPTLLLEHPDGIAASSDAIALFAGPPDAELVSDLQRAPLSSAHLARRVECEVGTSGTDTRVVPRHALAPAATYTLAVASWASTLRGGALSADGSASVFELHTSAEAEAGARVVQSWPADGASGLGTNLEAVVLAFDGVVHGADSAVWIEGHDGRAIATLLTSGPCAQVAPEHASSFCVRLALQQRLAPVALHRIVVGSDARDGHGAPVGPWQAAFRTAEGRDPEPPAALVSTCAIDEQAIAVGCALIDDASITLRLQADEPVIATLRLDDVVRSLVAADGQVLLGIDDLAAEAQQPAGLELRDSAGNAITHQLELRTTAALAALSISEVLADPLGAEPQQEFVEIVNYGTATIDLLGFSLGDRADMPGAPVERSSRVLPGARVLLVADGYDPREGSDPAPPPGALLVRVGRAIGSAGLRNAGEALYLRDALGRRISAAPATPEPRPGVCLVRTTNQMRSGAPGTFDHDANATCTPGE